MTASPLTGLTLDGTPGSTLVRVGDTATLTEASARVVLPIGNINALVYRRIQSPIFLLLAAALFLWGLYQFYGQPFLFTYRTDPFHLTLELAAYALIGTVILVLLFFVVTTFSLVIYSGSFQGRLAGSRDQLLKAMALLQP